MDLFDMKNMIKIKEQAYLNLLEQKRELELKKSDLKEIIDYVEELEKIYNENEISEELKQKADAIKESKELAKAFDEINSKIDGYEENHIKEQIEFLHTNQKMHELRDNLKEIELLSKKLSDKGSSNMKEVINPDGKTRKVHADFVETYKMYLKQIDQLEGKKLLNDYARIEGYSKAPIKVNKSNNEIENKLINDANNIELHEEQEQNLSLDENIRNTQIRIQEIFNSRYLPKHGKLCVVSLNGKKFEIPKYQRGCFAKLVGDLAKFNKAKSELNNTNYDEEEYKVTFEESIKSDVEEKKPVIEENIIEIKEVKNENKKEKRKKIKNIAKKVAAAAIALNILISARFLHKSSAKDANMDYASEKTTDIDDLDKYENISFPDPKKDKKEEMKVEITNEQPKESKTTQSEPPKPIQEPSKSTEEQIKEIQRKENLRKLSQNYTMNDANLTSVEKNGYFIQGEEKVKEIPKKELTEEQTKEIQRKENLRKLSQNYTMNDANLTSVEKNGYFIQGEEKDKETKKSLIEKLKKKKNSLLKKKTSTSLEDENNLIKEGGRSK